MIAAPDKGWLPDSPPLQGRGKGWGLSESRVAGLFQTVRESRGNPMEADR